MKTHTFYITEAQRNNLTNYLGLVASKLREEMHSDNPLQSEHEYERWIADAEGLQALFEFRGSTPLQRSEDTADKVEK